MLAASMRKQLYLKLTWSAIGYLLVQRAPSSSPAKREVTVHSCHMRARTELAEVKQHQQDMAMSGNVPDLTWLLHASQRSCKP